MKTLSDITIDYWQRNRVFPVSDSDDKLVIGMTETSSRDVLEDLGLLLSKPVVPMILSVNEVDEGIRQLLLEEQSEELEQDEAAFRVERNISQNLLEDVQGAPVIRWLNTIFLKSLESGASDIHIEPKEHETEVRMRIDGVLHELSSMPASRHQQIVARLKVMAKLDLAETRRPQDGRLQVHQGDNKIDIRISTVPIMYGERVVMRLLRKDTKLYSLSQIGMAEDTESTLQRLLSLPYGLILVTGPTGSGKTTSLYSMLDLVRSPERNVLTIEDPVEYQVEGVGQIQVKEKIGLTFAAGLRSILRQDPDVLMVGEIRDPETAEIAVNAALTGHLVLSTLHTNDAASATTRMIDLGVPPYLLSSCLCGALAQRLVRRLCKNCREAYTPSQAEIERLHIKDIAPGEQWYRPMGCSECLETGYRGRIGVFELISFPDELARAVTRSEDARTLKDLAVKHLSGFRDLYQDAVMKLRAGETSVEEAQKLMAVF